MSLKKSTIKISAILALALSFNLYADPVDVIDPATTYNTQAVDPYLVGTGGAWGGYNIATYGAAQVGLYQNWSNTYSDLLGFAISKGESSQIYLDADHNNYYDIASGLGIANAFSTVAMYDSGTGEYWNYGYNATAVGQGATVGAVNTTAVGYSAYATGTGATAYGAYAVANYAYGTAVGQGAWSGGFDAMALGAFSRANGDFSTAIGSYTRTNGEQSIGIGLNTYTSSAATQSIAVGSNSAVYGTQSIAVGANSGAYGNNSVAIGAGSVSFDDNEVSVGSAGNERRISNVATPINATDAANKQYVDDAIANISGGGSSLAESKDYTDQQIANVKQELRKEMHESTALAIALASPAVIEAGSDNAMSIGVGQYKSAAAIGLSFSRKMKQNSFVNLGVSAVGQNVASRASYNLSF